jgi:uncharacterized lipoprotein YddW (UPF0748 family)
MSTDRRTFIAELASMLSVTGVPTSRRATGAPVTELRGVWVETEQFSADPAKGKAQIRDTVQRLVDARLNLLLAWATSGYLVGLANPRYAKDHPTAKWDSLGYLLQEAGTKGLPVHLWYSFTDYRAADSPDFDPEVGGNPDWAAVRIDELHADFPTATGAARAALWDRFLKKPQWAMDRLDIHLSSQNRKHDVCPQHQGARQWQLRLLENVLKRDRQLAGVHIEEPGYDYPGNCVCQLCRGIFQQLYGQKLEDHLDSLEAQDFRCLGTSAFMSELYQMLRRNYPKLYFSANGGYDWRRERRLLGRDWARWVRMGWLDYYAAQVYTPSVDEFRQRLSMVVKNVGRDGPVAAGVGIRWSGHPDKNIPTRTVLKEIELAREVGAPGQVLFHAGVIDEELVEALRKGPYRTPAPPPFYRRS